MAVTKFHPTEDEINNMIVRRRAGETIESIADDYECDKRQVTKYTKDAIEENPGLSIAKRKGAKMLKRDNHNVGQAL